jgi:hypothetical protein
MKQYTNLIQLCIITYAYGYFLHGAEFPHRLLPVLNISKLNKFKPK